MEKKQDEEGKPHCLVLSFPLQGHINPMFQFFKRLKHAGIRKITLVTTKFFLKSVRNFPDSCFPVETISDGFDDGCFADVSPDEASSRYSEHGSRSLAELRSSGSPADCVIYDAFYPWVLGVAEKFGLMTAIFFTQPNSVNCIYFNAYRGELKLPVIEDMIRIPGGFPVLNRSDLPSFIQDYESDPNRSGFMMQQFRNVERVDWVFVNTFHQLEQEVTDWISKFMAVRTIGPTIPSTSRRQPIWTRSFHTNNKSLHQMARPTPHRIGGLHILWKLRGADSRGDVRISTCTKISRCAFLVGS